jgi:transcriptional regulator with XRE-family HTH domain
MRRAQRVKIVAGYGATLRRELNSAGMTQQQLAELTGVSRQTIARAINRDEVTDRTAERLTAVLSQAVTAVSRTTFSPAQKNSSRVTDDSPNSGRLSRKRNGGNKSRSRSDAWVRATDLQQWADRRDSQDTLPELMRKLILSAEIRATHVEFRAGEGVQLPGWDGLVTTGQGNAFVPAGTSAWELGVSGDPKQKADEDYAKRLLDPAGVDPATTTFIFVTLRRWSGKQTWAAQRRAEGVWRDVLVIDADDLESWLSIAPATHLWLSRRLGAFPEGAMDFGTAWADWVAATEPPLPPTFLLAGRQEAVKALQAWLESPRQALAVRAESREEVLAVVGAVIAQLPESLVAATLARCVVVYDAPSWRRLSASTQPLILFPLFEAGELVGAAMRAGHAVIVPLGDSDAVSDDALQIPMISRREAADALTVATSGRLERRVADEYAALGRRSMMALRRRLALSAGFQRPAWAKPESGRTVLPALLAGAWNDSLSGDRQVLATLSRAPYEEARDRLLHWADAPDPPLRRRNNAFYLVSRIDAWTLLSRFLTRDDLERFEGIATSVLGAPDPQFDLPLDQRWMSGVLAERPVHSPLLRHGIAETLAVMGARGGTGEPGWTPRDVAERGVRNLLEKANTDWKLWASLHDVLPDLAEAAPDAFLDAVETGVQGTTPVLRDVFTDRSDEPFTSSPHVGLVWAFERLAWSAEHLSRVTYVLARLAEVDPGGRYSNRPTESLATIYRPWLPQTAATLEQRFRIIDMLRERIPAVAWPLLASMLPEFHGVGIYGSRPHWRDWAPDSERKILTSEYALAVREVVARMLRDVGSDGSRWRVLIEALPMVSSEDYELVRGRLTEIDVTHLPPSDRTQIWNALRVLIASHRSFQGADWAMAPEFVDRLDPLVTRFEPEDPVARYGYLFGYHPELLEGQPADENERSWQAHNARLAEKRRSAVDAVFASAGLEGLVGIARVVEEPNVVGFLAADIPAVTTDELAILGAHLASSDSHVAAFAHGFAARRVEMSGRAWVTDVVARAAGSEHHWSTAQRAHILYVLRPTPDTWRLAAEQGQEVEHLYWQRLPVYGVDVDDTDHAVRHLLAAARPNSALQLLAHRVASMRGRGPAEQVPDPSLAVQVLSQAMRDESEEAMVYDRPSSSTGYCLRQLLNALSRVSSVDDQQLARLEWRYLPIVGRYNRRPIILEGLLVRDAKFFVEVVECVYRGEGDEPREASDEDRERATRGHTLLHAWRTLPGTTRPIGDGRGIVDDDDGHDKDLNPAADSSAGAVDATALRAWVTEARSALAKSGRSAIGDQLIGQVLSASPYDPDGTWPSAAVRDLIEEVASTELERGFWIGLYNRRGVTTRDSAAGGTLERGLAERYDGLAAVVADKSPRTGRLLRQIAEDYRRDAMREDHEAALGEDLGM